MKRFSLGLIGFLFLFLAKEKQAWPKTPLRKPVYYTLNEILQQNGQWHLDTCSAAEFTFTYPLHWFDVFSTAKIPGSNVVLRYRHGHQSLSVGSLYFDLDKMIAWPDGDSSLQGLEAEGSAYRFVARKDTFIYFSSHWWMSCGTGYNHHFHFLVNTRKHQINIWEVYGYFFEGQTFIGDINNDSIPDFLFPHFVTWRNAPFSDTTEIMHIHPYIGDSTGHYKPLLDKEKYVHYTYAVNFHKLPYTDRIVRRLTYSPR